MASPRPQRTPEPERPQPRLYLITPRDADIAALARALAAILAATDIAAVLLRLPDADERSLITRVKTLAPVVQAHGTALILDGHADIVARAGADGAHLSGIEAFNDALATLKPERIAGCGGLASRHDAMLAAEAGADYIMFGEPDADGRRPPFEAIEERISWWAEVFEAPCVGYAAEAGEIAALVAAGADFIAVGPFVFDDPRGPAIAVGDVAADLVVSEVLG
jgi:thiamine-phosphate pyrophosphorylase